MQKLALKSRFVLFKSCRVILKETNKIGFEFLSFFTNFYEFSMIQQNPFTI
jgi:hypothetical protein